MSYLLLNLVASELALSQEIEVIDSVLNDAANTHHRYTVNRFRSRLLALRVAFKYPFFCCVVVGSLPSEGE